MPVPTEVVLRFHSRTSNSRQRTPSLPTSQIQGRFLEPILLSGFASYFGGPICPTLCRPESFTEQADEKLHANTNTIHNHDLALSRADGFFAGLLGSSHSSTAEADAVGLPPIDKLPRRPNNSCEDLLLRFVFQVQDRDLASSTPGRKVAKPIVKDGLLVEYLGSLARGNDAHLVSAHPRGIEGRLHDAEHRPLNLLAKSSDEGMIAEAADEKSVEAIFDRHNTAQTFGRRENTVDPTLDGAGCRFWRREAVDRYSRRKLTDDVCEACVGDMGGRVWVDQEDVDWGLLSTRDGWKVSIHFGAVYAFLALIVLCCS
jgi:hypothetical protein